MSEEEEDNITIELVKLAIRFEENGECHIKKITLEQMLDLYEKEKEKEKNLLEQLKDSEKELLEVTQNVVSKDKIRAKIKEIEKEIHVVIPNEYNKIEVMNENKNEGAINVLQELLLEENKSDENNI